MRGPDPARRRSVAAIAIVALAALAPPAYAQDPRGVAAQSAAREWLALTDRMDAAKSYGAADAKFRSAMTLERWTSALKKIRTPLGALERRAVVATRFERAPKGFPPGQYALVQFRASFAHQSAVQETVTLDRDSAGVWRVVGYALT